MGWGAAELKYRFNWNFPLLFSPHDPNVLYAAANVLFKSTDEGQSWQAISGDLTRNIKEKQGSSGGPITKDNTSVEYYGTIFAVAESTMEPGVIWAGSDDGLVHVSRDGGSSWTDVTPRGLPEEIQINSVDAHPFESGGLYLAATAYKSDDFRPWLYKTTDYGQRWVKITDGIAADHFTRVIRADPARPGLLYSGTERGVYVSHDDGAQWQPLQLNLPISPVTDLAVKQGNLVAATQGRGFWILDDLTFVRQLQSDSFDSGPQLFQPSPVYQLTGGTAKDPLHQGTNPPAGALIRYWLATEPGEEVAISLDILDGNGETIRQFSRKPGADAPPDAEPPPGDDDRILTADQGLNQVEWNLRWPSAESFPGMVLWNRNLAGPRAVPGSYVARLTVGEESRTVPIEILADPRLDVSDADYRAQFNFLWDINQTLTRTHQSIRLIRDVKSQLAAVSARISDEEDLNTLKDASASLTDQLTAIEESLYQTQLESPQDPLNFPIRSNDKLAGLITLVGIGQAPPTESAIAVKQELTAAIESELDKLEELLAGELAAFNTRAAELDLPAISVQP